MLGANIDRNMTSNRMKDDEVAYVNRMKIHLKSHPELKSKISRSGQYGNFGTNVSLTRIKTKG